MFLGEILVKIWPRQSDCRLLRRDGPEPDRAGYGSAALVIDRDGLNGTSRNTFIVYNLDILKNGLLGGNLEFSRYCGTRVIRKQR